jgi:DNA mismatch repair protein MutL
VAAIRPREPVLPGAGARPAARFLQVLDTYIAHDAPEGLVLVDQHALHERILYSRLQRDLAAGELGSQELLLPVPLRLPPTAMARAFAESPALARLGLRVEPFGPDTLAVRAVPSVLRGESLEELLLALLDPPEAHGGIPTGLDRRLFTLACHAAVKAGDPLDEREIEDLLRQGAELEHDATCPHGRPTRLVIGRVELERLFKRAGF